MNGREISGEEKYRLEQQFQALRDKVLRTHFIFLFLFFAPLLLFLFEPDQKLLIGVPVLWILGGVVLFWYNRKYWRCPHCSQRWNVPHIITSGNWEFCPKCGVSLKRISNRPHLKFMDPHRLEEIQTKFERNQKFRNMLASTGFPLIFIFWASLQRQNLSHTELGIIVIAVGVIFIGTYVFLSRCTNCQKGIILHKDRFCARCGINLKKTVEPSGGG
ncbi:MAG TPA: hypothetical protein VGB26_07285 [Nitrospiria bacterium]|jgi:ribosomal protein S27AE